MTDTSEITNLSLYHYQTCPYCAVTRRVIAQTGADIEKRDIRLSSAYRSELISEGGRPQVPCLRIEKDNGNVEWLYESADINRFIRQYAEQTSISA